MKQHAEMKRKFPDAMLLFRVGDFYETFGEDARKASQILGITLTRKASGGGGYTDLAGIPYHAVDQYLPRLVKAGLRVAICEQLEDPKTVKGLVKRGITELVTPGVSYNDMVLDVKENNFLCGLHLTDKIHGVSFLDVSTGEFYVAQGDLAYIDKLMQNFHPAEVVLQRKKLHWFLDHFAEKYYTNTFDDWVFTSDFANELLNKQFGTTSLKGFGVEHLQNGVVAAGVILQYMEMTQHLQLGHITALRRIEEDRFVRLDKFTIRNLELVGSMNEGGISLLDVIDKTVTPMGARMLHRWMLFPLKDPVQIGKRQDVVENFFRNPDTRDAVLEQLQTVGDLERIISKVSTRRVSPRDIVQLRVALQAVEPIKQICQSSEDGTLREIGQQLDLCAEIRDRIAREVRPDCPLLVANGGVIMDGVDAELDELRKIAYQGKGYLLEMQQREIEATGIQSLKIGYNNVFGYYLEVRNTYKDQVPADWIRKQTLTQAERYITQELKEYEDKIMGAEERILSLEAQIFDRLITALAAYVAPIQKDASLLAQLDCLLSFAQSAQENRYIRPIVDDSDVIDIHGGRHPVIEKQLPVGERYIANDVFLDTQTQQIIIITGPNMAGKSALLRQTALITLLAQMGSFVPAESARIGFVDKIFTRVGASDNISIGESTFMVEMNEAAGILNNLSERSLVLFDELGRGTSTYDGISIAWAIVEYIHENNRGHARTLFATHYHELNEMEKTFQRIKNFNVSVKEVDGKVIFLRKLERGGSEHSFGIHVAKLAGMPRAIVARANVILKELEGAVNHQQLGTTDKRQRTTDSGVQMNFFQLDDPVLCQIRDEILGLDINNLTPFEALSKLNDIKKLVKGSN